MAIGKLVEAFAPSSSWSEIAMPGGASTRKYFRVSIQAAGPVAGPMRAQTTAVAMFVPEGGKPEEIHKGAHAARWPFLEVRDLLSARGIDVPKVFVDASEDGWLLIEDLGDDTLANFLLRQPQEKESVYTRAVTDLANAQKALAELPADSIVGTRAFDADLLRWEIDHFREWGVEGRGIALTAEDRVAFDGIAERLSKRIADLSRGFTHRDYQSRNLMVRENGSLVWIDFQDALLGPRVYDLVALLNDSYQEFDRAFVEARLAEYAAARGLSAKESRAVVLEFDLVTVQRKLKDAGRFVFIDKVKNNRSFLKFVTPTIRKVRTALSRLRDGDKDMAALDAILTRTLGAEYTEGA
jgi:aminoglycoside/choline kinase family phosphotransferase